jgi:hypothetical protein
MFIFFFLSHMHSILPPFCIILLYCNFDCNCNLDYHSTLYRHSGCICPPLYEGPHCEFLVSKLGVAGQGGSSSDSDSDDDDDSSDSGTNISTNGLAALAVFIVGTMALVALFGARSVGKRLKRVRNGEKDAPPEVNLQGFRDERDENFGAVSSNGNSLFPSFSMEHVESARAHDAQLYDVEFVDTTVAIC